MTRLVVDLPALERLTHRMEAFQQHLTRARDESQQRVAALHLVWTGEAAAAQAEAAREWDRATTQMQQALALLRSNAATAHANYVAALAANRTMWSA